MTNRGIWIVDGNRMIRYIPLPAPTVRQRLTAWVKTVCQRIIVWLAVLACWPVAHRCGLATGPGPSARRPGG